MALALVSAGFAPQERAWAIGIFSSVTGLAVVSGPVVGGAVTQGLAWQWIFWLNVPIGSRIIPLILTRLAATPVTGLARPAPASTRSAWCWRPAARSAWSGG